MRIRVLIDVRIPLKRYKKIRKVQGDSFTVHFKYEKLNSFCFLCGMLRHTEKFCDKFFFTPKEQTNRDWGPWLRTATRGRVDTEGEKWLWNEQGGLISDKYRRVITGIEEDPQSKITPERAKNQASIVNHTPGQFMQPLKTIPKITGFSKTKGDTNKSLLEYRRWAGGI